jgi:DNA ligase-associated metallophosphoesterase
LGEASLKISVCGEDLVLRPENALWWPSQSLLALSDVHLGKAQSLRREGINIPVESGTSDLAKLETLLTTTLAKRVLFLGDLIHHRDSWTPDFLERLADFFNFNDDIRWELILGNHERGSLKYLERLPLQISEDQKIGPFTFTHGHKGSDGDFSISGHVHPVVNLKKGPLQMRLRCFVLNEDQLILPSFGQWTGGFEIKPKQNSRIFAIAGADIFEI